MKKIEKKKLIGLLSATACACLATACVVCAPMQNYEVNADSVSEISLDFSEEAHASNFTALNLGGFTQKDGKYYPSQEGNWKGWNLPAIQYNQTISLTEKKYIAMDFKATQPQFDICLLDSSASNMWGNSLTIHLPNYESNLSVTGNIDIGAWYGGVPASHLLDGNTHLLEIFVENSKVSYKVDGVTPVLDSRATEFDIPAEEVKLIIRACGTESFIDNLYIGKEKPAQPALLGSVIDFESAIDGNYFAPSVGSAGWSVADGIYKPNASWAAIYTTETLDLTKDWSVKFDMYLGDNAFWDEGNGIISQQFNVGFHSDFDPEVVKEPNTGITYSFGSTIWISSNFGRRGWLSENTNNYYTASVHTVEIQIVKKAMTLFVDGTQLYFLTNGAPYQAVATDDTVYMLLQSTDATAYIDNLEIKEKIAKYVVTVKDIDGNELAKERAEGAYVLPERAETDKGAFIGYNVNGELYSAGKEINVTADTEIVAVFAKLSMDEKASVRLEDPSGLRFTTRVENDAYTYLQSVSTVALGTLITKADYFTNGDYSGFTTEFAETKLDILSKVGKVDGENYVFNGVIVGVKSSHYDWDFVSRGYMTVTYADGTSATFYTNTTVRSIAFVANEAYLDRNAEYDETVYKYLTADGDYSRYTEDELKLLDSFKTQA